MNQFFLTESQAYSTSISRFSNERLGADCFCESKTCKVQLDFSRKDPSDLFQCNESSENLFKQIIVIYFIYFT